MIDVIAERSPFGGLERWLGDPDIDEVIVNGAGDVWIERSGALLRVATMSASAVATAIEHILRPIGRRLDRSNPTVDARLPNGSRVCAVIEPGYGEFLLLLAAFAWAAAFLGFAIVFGPLLAGVDRRRKAVA